MTKLKAKLVPYSSTVGGGLQLLNEQGHTVFIVAFIGARGISKEQTAALGEQFAGWINEHGLTCPDK